MGSSPSLLVENCCVTDPVEADRRIEDSDLAAKAGFREVPICDRNGRPC